MANDAKIATLLYDDDDAASQCVHLQTYTLHWNWVFFVVYIIRRKNREKIAVLVHVF